MNYRITDKQLEEAYKIKQMSDHELAAWMNEILQRPLDEPTKLTIGDYIIQGDDLYSLRDMCKDIPNEDKRELCAEIITNTIKAKSSNEPTVKESLTVEPEKWEYVEVRRRIIKFRNKEIQLDIAFDEVLQELAEAKAEIARMKPQPPEKMVCSGCGQQWKSWHGKQTGNVCKPIPESEYKKEKK